MATTINLSTVIHLRHGQLIKPASMAPTWYMRRVHFGTVEGYALENKEDTKKALDRAQANGHELVWGNQEAAVLHNGTEEQKTQERAKFDADMAAATPLASGDIIRAEGRMYRVRWNGPRFSDPFGFQPL